MDLSALTGQKKEQDYCDRRRVCRRATSRRTSTTIVAFAALDFPIDLMGNIPAVIFACHEPVPRFEAMTAA
jgi:hypothetical protein